MSNTTLNTKSTYKLNNGKEIPIAGFGLYLTEPGETATITYNALKVGYRHIDSAAYYQNEQESVDGIAKFLADYPEVKREDIFYTTKLEVSRQGYEQAKLAISESLEKAAKIEYIDLYLIHGPLASKADRLGEWKALQEAVQEGKIKSIGVSNYGVSHLQELLDWEGLTIKPTVNQVELHPFLPRHEFREIAKKNDIYLEAYAPLTTAKKFDDPDVQAVAKKHNYTPAQVLLRWSYDQGFIVLAKTTSIERTRDNFEVLDKVTLDEEDFKTLDKPDAYELTSGWPFDPTTYVDEADK
ncbi:NAD(P)H-dependent D-xylose reductase [[Candida] anglica]|uniref:NAD(P)H-dependent D-xylose reductase n=1 Tax=[Candida] anglica TaxID=148631 RepID=A0ABP0EGF6_9ASCO